jgi:L-amino acid N-acyltransferase YncA
VVPASNVASIHLLEKLGFERVPDTHRLNQAQGIALDVAALSKPDPRVRV